MTSTIHRVLREETVVYHSSVVDLRALIFDIDGTLTARDGVPVPAVVTAITQCRDAGLACFVATARRPASAVAVLNDLAWLADSGVFHAGALGRCRRSAWQADTVLIAERVRDLISIIHDVNPYATISIHAADGTTGFGPAQPSDELMRAWSCTAQELIPFASARTRAACKIGVTSRGERLDKIVAVLAERFPNDLALLLFDQGQFLNITVAGTTKASMMGQLLARRGLSWEESVAFGDDLSDLPLLEAAGYGVAMDDGNPALHMVADEIAPGPQRGGIALVLRRLFPAICI